MYAKKVVMIGNKYEEDIGIRGDQLHSPEALYRMEDVSPLKPLDLMQSFFVEISTFSI